MKTETSEREIKTIGSVTSKSFFIKEENTVHIVKILRNKLYSNKILAVMREYITNAIDANIENKSETPIEIQLPTQMDPYFKVRDFGKGLSQKEIENVFISYGTSTKRNSDDFTGCLGIGSKAAFSYSDSFLINSYKNGKVFKYLSFLDESGLGSISLLSTLPSKEDSGIEICVPIKLEDFESFEREFFSYAMAINFPYKLTGQREDSFILNVFQKEKGIVTLSSNIIGFNSENILFSRNEFITGFYAVMGNVAYKIDQDWFEENIDSRIFPDDSLVVFRLDIGKIDFSSNRESIELTPESETVLKESLKEFKDCYKESIELDFFSNSLNLQHYSSLKLNIELSSKVLDNGQGKLFDLRNLEFVLNQTELLSNTESLTGRALIIGESSIRLCTLVRSKEALEIFFKKDSQFKFKSRNFPILVVGSSKKSKDEEIIYNWKNSISESSHERIINKKFSEKFPGFGIVKEDLIGNRGSLSTPIIFLVYPVETLTREEYISKLENAGFGIIKIEDFMNFSSGEENVKVVRPSKMNFCFPDQTSSWERFQNLDDNSTLEEFKELLEESSKDVSKIILVDCKGRYLTSTKEIRICSKKDRGIYASVHDHNYYQVGRRFCELYFNLFDKIPVFVEPKKFNLKESGFEVIDFSSFQEQFFNELESRFNNFSEEEKRVFRSSRYSEVYWDLPQHLTEEIYSLGFKDIESFKKIIKFALCVFRDSKDLTKLLLKGKKQIKKYAKRLEKFFDYLSKNSIMGKVKIKNRKLIKLIQDSVENIDRIGNGEENNQSYSRVISKENEEYFSFLLRKLKQSDLKFLFQLNYIHKEILDGSFYYRRDVLNKEDMEKAIFIINNLF